jgi:hypothetical protein
MATSSLYIAIITTISFICFALSCAAVFLPNWGHFEEFGGGFGSERGYFSPWKVCKELSYNREQCGQASSRFRPSSFVFASGIMIVVSTITLGIYCILSVIQIAAISSREKIVMKYSTLVMTKLGFAAIGALATLTSAAMFALQTDDPKRNFSVSRGISFYLVVIAVVLSILLLVLSLYDLMYSRRSGGDPTQVPDVTGSRAITYDNPGYREGEQNRGISMTRSSGRPYVGSIGSVTTTMTSVSNGSTMTDGSVIMTSRGPLRSSLKKPRPKPPTDEFGIQNPGFHGVNKSPSMERKGSVKKVRINTHSTEV